MEGLQRYQLAALALNSTQVAAGYTKTHTHATVNVLNPPVIYKIILLQNVSRKRSSIVVSWVL